MSGFAEQLAKLVSAEMRNATPSEAAEVVERLIHSAGFTIALMASGDKAKMDELLAGAEGYLYEAAAQHQRIAGMLRGKPRP